MRAITVFILSINLFLAACHNTESKPFMLKEGKFTEGVVESEKVRLQYLDWDGNGQVLVMICGLGDTPFLFEDLAAQLSPQCRVIAYSRRGHGRSETREEKYDTETLVSDLKLLLDSLKIDKVSLLGWSMGGNEITEFALRYPNQVNKLIYFESGYDLSDGGFGKLVTNTPKSFLPDSSTMRSLDNYRKWYHRFWFGDIRWNNALEDNLQASVRVNSDSSIETIPHENVFRSILKEAMQYRRNYKGVQAPSLVIYTKPFFYPADSSLATLALYDSLESNVVSPWREANKRRIAEELRNAVVVEAPSGTHTSFLFSSENYLAKTIGSFLDVEKEAQ